MTFLSVYLVAGAEAGHANKYLMSLISDEVLSTTDTFVTRADWQSTPREVDVHRIAHRSNKTILCALARKSAHVYPPAKEGKPEERSTFPPEAEA